MGERNDNELVLRTFSKAFAKQKDVTGPSRSQRPEIPVHVSCLPRHAAKGWRSISMSRRENCYGNASMESFFSHLKTEGLYPYHVRTLAEAQNKIEKYIRFYNRKRPQRKLKN